MGKILQKYLRKIISDVNTKNEKGLFHKWVYKEFLWINKKFQNILEKKYCHERYLKTVI